MHVKGKQFRFFATSFQEITATHQGADFQSCANKLCHVTSLQIHQNCSVKSQCIALKMYPLVIWELESYKFFLPSLKSFVVVVVCLLFQLFRKLLSFCFLFHNLSPKHYTCFRLFSLLNVFTVSFQKVITEITGILFSLLIIKQVFASVFFLPLAYGYQPCFAPGQASNLVSEMTIQTVRIMLCWSPI